MAKMINNESVSEKFPGYDESYIADLLGIVTADTQDNTTVGDDDYLTMALEACNELNQSFANKTFDRGETK